MEKLKVGKLYFLCATEAMLPFNVLFGTNQAPINFDADSKEITIPDKTLGIYLATISFEMLSNNYPPDLAQVIYYKFLIGDQILYLIEDGCCVFKQANNDPSLL